MPHVILITGQPASGKTTLAVRLAHELGLPLIARDALKEKLCDALGCDTAERSGELGDASWKLLYHVVEQLLQGGTPFIVESNFHPTYDAPTWRVLQEKYSANITQIVCRAPREVILQRYRDRVIRGERHAVHFDDADDYPERFFEMGDTLDIDSRTIIVDTTQSLDGQLANARALIQTQ